MMLARYPTQI